MKELWLYSSNLSTKYQLYDFRVNRVILVKMIYMYIFPVNAYEVMSTRWPIQR